MNRIETENRVAWSALGAVAGAGIIAASLAIFKKRPFQFGWLTVGAAAGGSIAGLLTKSRSVENPPEKNASSKDPIMFLTEGESQGEVLAFEELPSGRLRAVFMKREGGDRLVRSDRLWDNRYADLFDNPDFTSLLKAGTGEIDRTQLLSCTMLSADTIISSLKRGASLGGRALDRVIHRLYAGDFPDPLPLARCLAEHCDLSERYKESGFSKWIYLSARNGQVAVARDWADVLTRAGVVLDERDQFVKRVVDGDFEVSDHECFQADVEIYEVEKWRGVLTGEPVIVEPAMSPEPVCTTEGHGTYRHDQLQTITFESESGENRKWNDDQFRAYLFEDGTRLAQLSPHWAQWVLNEGIIPKDELSVEQAQAAYIAVQQSKWPDVEKRLVLRRLRQIHPACATVEEEK